MAPSRKPAPPSAPPSLSSEQAILYLEQQLQRLEAIRSLHFKDPEVEAWESLTVNILNEAFGKPNGDPHDNTSKWRYAQGPHSFIGMKDIHFKENHLAKQDKRRALLKSYIEQLKLLTPPSTTQEPPKSTNETALERACQILRRFHRTCLQLRDRHGGRPTLRMEDEYDVQYLLSGLLQIDFTDVRSEEWVPSYAGGASRMDFLLKEEKIVIEAKKTRSSLRDKEIGEELLIDIGKYAHHVDCQTLICFVYDPDSLIRNPEALRVDLERKSSPILKVVVIIVPRH